MNWLSLVGGLISLVQALVNYLHDRKLIDQGVAQEMLAANQAALDAITKANAAKQAVTDAATRDPGSVLTQDDGFKRPD